MNENVVPFNFLAEVQKSRNINALFPAGELPLSELDTDFFDIAEQSLITQLIKKNKWIEEESLDLLSLLQKNGFIKP